MVERPKKVSIPPPKEILRLKVAILGDGGVGKSSLADRFCNNSYEKTYVPTIAVDYKNKIIPSKEQQININFWDFSGHPEFFEVRNEFYREVNAIMLVFDVCAKKSLDGLDVWIREANKYGANKDAVVFVIGNKSDETSRRTIGEREGKDWANAREFTYWEVSAATSTHNSLLTIFYNVLGALVNEMFQDLIEKCTRK